MGQAGIAHMLCIQYTIHIMKLLRKNQYRINKHTMVLISMYWDIMAYYPNTCIRVMTIPRNCLQFGGKYFNLKRGPKFTQNIISRRLRGRGGGLN